MKVSKEQLAENRQRILDAAARLFRERGFEGVTVAEIMAAADLTHGAFYGHFSSKEDLIARSFAHVLFPDTEKPEEGTMADYAGVYLSARHRDGPGNGCLFSTLGTEVGRTEGAARHTMTQALERRIEIFSQTAPGETPEERRRAAIAGWAAMVGAMVLARISDDPALSDEIMRETRETLGA
ncbi:TetR family transcriptional regulator [Labrys miyagiensis]|uniref:TetR family transcriptional regulator n=1 Tax=Labrys miyagiensis TaxID=346912 RepID=A0ABQ6CSC3_9HYPH|nr:TetR/AcrR family transcriptional regulator [Labrys miyagiensis]GLS23266.1 TetR family transcriptional regulator [Labrys miyagiensis]